MLRSQRSSYMQDDDVEKDNHHDDSYKSDGWTRAFLHEKSTHFMHAGSYTHHVSFLVAYYSRVSTDGDGASACFTAGTSKSIA